MSNPKPWPKKPPGSLLKQRVVDRRDVADIHLNAILHPQACGQHFLATSDGVVHVYDVARIIPKGRPEKATRLAALTPTPAEFYKQISNQKSQEILGWQYRGGYFGQRR